jgi:hypothetical protein
MEGGMKTLGDKTKAIKFYANCHVLLPLLHILMEERAGVRRFHFLVGRDRLCPSPVSSPHSFLAGRGQNVGPIKQFRCICPEPF